MGRLKIKDYVVRKTPLLGFLNAENVNINTRKAGVDPWHLEVSVDSLESYLTDPHKYQPEWLDGFLQWMDDVKA